MDAATRRDTTVVAGPDRQRVGSTRTGAGVPSRCGWRSAARVSAAGSAPRNEPVVASGSPVTSRSEPVPQSWSSRREVASTDSWWSSTATSRQRERSAASRSASPASSDAASSTMPAGSNAPGVRSAVTSRYSRITSAAATHSCRPRWRPIRARSSGSSPRSSARMSSSRSSARSPLSRNAGRTCSGQSGTAPSPARWPSTSSRSTVSCSGPEISRGLGSPASTAARRISPNAYEAGVRASGSPTASGPTCASRAVTRSRSAAAASRDGASTSTFEGSSPSRATRATTDSTSVVVLPVPGAPTSTSGPLPARRATTSAWTASSSGGSTAPGRAAHEAQRRGGGRHAPIPPQRPDSAA